MIQSPDRKKWATNVQRPPSLSLPIQSTGKGHAYCVLCRKPGPRLIVVPTEARFNVYLCHNLFTPAGFRCCPSHFCWPHIFKDGNVQKNHPFVNRATIIELLKLLRDEANIKRKTLLDFNDPESMTNDGYVTLTGLRKCDFDDILTWSAPQMLDRQDQEALKHALLYFWQSWGHPWIINCLLCCSICLNHK